MLFSIAQKDQPASKLIRFFRINSEWSTALLHQFLISQHVFNRPKALINSKTNMKLSLVFCIIGGLISCSLQQGRPFRAGWFPNSFQRARLPYYYFADQNADITEMDSRVSYINSIIFYIYFCNDLVLNINIVVRHA